jgi:hypothetical protein
MAAATTSASRASRLLVIIRSSVITARRQHGRGRGDLFSIFFIGWRGDAPDNSDDCTIDGQVCGQIKRCAEWRESDNDHLTHLRADRVDGEQGTFPLHLVLRLYKEKAQTFKGLVATF